MHITVYCPRCGNKLRLEPEMRGRKMRCPNSICREIFEVREEVDEPAVPAPKPEVPPDEADAAARSTRRTAAPAEANFVKGSVGDLVPLLTVESAEDSESTTAEKPPSATVGNAVPLLPPEAAPEIEPPAAPLPSWQSGPPPVRRSSPGVGEVVPLLPTQPTADAKSPEPSWQGAPPPARRSKPSEPAPVPLPPQSEQLPAAEIPNWQQAPPPVRQPAVAAPPKAPVEANPKELPPERSRPRRKSKETIPSLDKRETPPPPPEPTSVDAPTELPPGAWDAPPVRRPMKDEPQSRPIEKVEEATEWPGPSSVTSEEPHPEPARGRKVLWICAALLVLLGGGITFAFIFGVVSIRATEEVAAKQAQKDYDEGKFDAAAQGYRALRKRFPDSPKDKEYEFWEDFSQVRHQIKIIDVDADTALEQLRAFIRKHDAGPFLHLYDADVWQAYVRILEDKLIPEKGPNVTPQNFEKEEHSLAVVREVEKEAGKFVPEGRDNDSGQREERIRKWQAAIRYQRAAKEFVDHLGQHGKEMTLRKKAEAEQEAQKRGIADHPDVIAYFKYLDGTILPGTWKEGGVTLKTPPADSAETLLAVPRLDADDRGSAGPVNSVVFALARGVLYALRADNGRVVWADRVGIDTSTLPLRLPKGEANPRELILVLSSDTNTLTARDALTGEPQWQYPLGQPCLGRPVLVNRRAYVATVDGVVHEIEIVKGQLLGRYELDVPLSGAGAHEEGTSLVYFPAVAGFVYVLDVDQRKCVAVLQTGHPSGSLRGEPVLVGGGRPADPMGGPPRYLILTQTDGLEAMKLRAYKLPVTGVVKTAPEAPEPQVRGWSWFPPYSDGEKVVLATDAGVLGLFGVNQFHNADAPLFPLLPKETALTGDARQRGRALVVHAAENDFWVLAQGRLQQYRLGLSADKGLHVTPVWPQGLALGSPLHSGQASDDQDTLFVVSQEPDRQACLATAIDAATGKVRWQRQLGLSNQGDPLLLTGRVLTRDPSGLFVFDPKEKAPLLPRTVEKKAAPATAWLSPAADGQSVYALTIPAPGRLGLRRLGTDGRVKETWEDFRGTLGGTPALGPNALVLPLADGNLARLALTSGARPDGGPRWRADHADAGAVGHVTALGGNDFLFTDGSRGLRRFTWPAAIWDPKSEIKATLADRIVAAPLALPGGDKATQLCIADAAGNLSLLDAGKLTTTRTWKLGGKVTAGPYLLGKRIGCVLDRRKLVCLDPGNEKLLWEYQMENGDGIVGRPQEAGGAVLVADLSGRFVSLDPETGQPRGPGYTLKASAAPAAAPVAFGEDRVLAPLTDGTVLLLTLEQLTKPAVKP